MPTHVPGRPVWMDLMTDDVDAAKRFYGELFGWTFADQGEEFGHYTIVTKDDMVVAGLMSTLMSPEGPTTEPTSPTTWSIYLHTPDLDDALSVIPSTGAQVVFGPMDVADQGRQAFVVDPAGAALGLWQPVAMNGFDLRPGAFGTPAWFECLSTDIDAALPFYREVLRWEVSWMGESGSAETDEPAAGFRYATDGRGDEAVAGLCDASQWLEDGHPSFWRLYLSVEDTDAACARVEELGGTVLSAPEDSPFGRFAQVTDPQGATFMVIA